MITLLNTLHWKSVGCFPTTIAQPHGAENRGNAMGTPARKNAHLYRHPVSFLIHFWSINNLEFPLYNILCFSEPLIFQKIELHRKYKRLLVLVYVNFSTYTWHVCSG